MNKDREVDVKDEEIKHFVDGIKPNEKSLSTSKHIPIGTDLETDLDEKHMAIFHYIRGNQGIIERNVIDAFNNKPGYSRKIVLRKIRELDQKYRMIVIRPDKNNIRYHHLFVNNDNYLVSLIADFDSFQQAYFDLIDTLNSFVNNKRIIFTGLLGLVENMKLVNAVGTPFRLLLNTYTIFDLHLSDNCDDVYLHRRFAIIRDRIKEIQKKLYDSVFKEPLVKSCDIFFTNTYLYDNLNLLTNILDRTIQGSGYEDIEAMLIAFDQYELKENAETLLDRLWKIIYPVFPIAYPRYHKENPIILRDWRKVVGHFRNIDVTTQVLAYTKSVGVM